MDSVLLDFWVPAKLSPKNGPLVPYLTEDALRILFRQPNTMAAQGRRDLRDAFKLFLIPRTWETFDFLGFRHVMGTSRKGKFGLVRKGSRLAQMAGS